MREQPKRAEKSSFITVLLFYGELFHRPSVKKLLKNNKNGNLIVLEVAHNLGLVMYYHFLK